MASSEGEETRSWASCSWTWSRFCIVRFRMNGACLIFTHYFMNKERNRGPPRSTMEGQIKDGSALTGLTTGGSRATTFCNARSFGVGFPTIAATWLATSTVRRRSLWWGAVVVELQKARTLVTKLNHHLKLAPGFLKAWWNRIQWRFAVVLHRGVGGCRSHL